MKKIIIYALLLMVGLSNQACGAKNNKNKNKMTNVNWGTSVGVPRFFDIWLKYSYVGFGDKGAKMPALGYIRGGIGEGSANVALNDFDKVKPVPNSLDIAWLSNVDRKIYEGNFVFSEELQNKILAYFREGYRLTELSEPFYSDNKYDALNVTIIPGGRVILYLVGAGRRVCLDTILQCQVREVPFNDFYTYNGYNSIDEYVNTHNAADEGPIMLSILEKYGRDYVYKLWDRYLEQFRYDIVINYEDSNTVEGDFYYTEYANGDIYIPYKGELPELKSRLKNLRRTWYVDKTRYTAHFYINEYEVLEIFDKAFGKDRNQKGEFVINVSKYNNSFEIFLRVGDTEYKFENTQIYVYRQRPEDDGGYLFYDNLNGEEIIPYIGG